jgi:hypothetical protein
MHRLPIAILFAAAACDSVASTDVTTAELGVYVYVEVDADARAEVTARLTTDNPALLEVTYVRLAGGDTLRAQFPLAAAQTMTERSILGLYEYIATFDGVTGGQVLTVSLDRALETDALATTVAMPADLTVAASATTFAHASGVTLTWSGGTGASEVAVAVRDLDNCVDNFVRTAPLNAGQLALATTDFVLKPNPPSSCRLEVELGAVATGTADPAYGRGGNVTARQSRTLALTMTR